MSENVLPTESGQMCMISCNPYTNNTGVNCIGRFTGMIEDWGTENEPCTVYQFHAKEYEDTYPYVYISKEHDVIMVCEDRMLPVV